MWNPEKFVLHFIGHLLKSNSAKKKQNNLEKYANDLIDITRNFSKTTTSYLQQVSKNYSIFEVVIILRCNIEHVL